MKNYRRIKEWEWYTEPLMSHLWQHLIREAAFQDKTWRGISIKRGQYFTTLPDLSNETGISVQSLRTCLKRLKSTGELTAELTGNKQLLTICNYESYQGEDPEANRQSNSQSNSPANRRSTGDLTGDQQANPAYIGTRDKNVKNTKNEEETKNTKKQTKKNDPLLSMIDILDDSEPDYVKIAFAFWKLIRGKMAEVGVDFKHVREATKEKWSDPIRLAMKNDNRTVEEFREIFVSLEKQNIGKEFTWLGVTRSTKKLREKFDDILLNARTENMPSQGRNGHKNYTMEDAQREWEELKNQRDGEK